MMKDERLLVNLFLRYILKILERVIGLEPMINGFAIRRLNPAWLYPLAENWNGRRDLNPQNKIGSLVCSHLHHSRLD